MKDKKLLISVIINVILIILLFVVFFTKPSKTIYVDSTDKAIKEINKNKDSIQVRIDTLYIKLKDNSIKYEKFRDTIIANSTLDDYVFFSNYLIRHNSFNNSKPTKGN